MIVTVSANESCKLTVPTLANELISWIVANKKNESSAKIVSSGKE